MCTWHNSNPGKDRTFPHCDEGDIIGCLAELSEEGKEGWVSGKLSFTYNGGAPFVVLEDVKIPPGQTLNPAFTLKAPVVQVANLFRKSMRFLPKGFKPVYEEEPENIKNVAQTSADKVC